ncbi:MAG: PepSY domain-containing protein [Anaerolineae bacterium]
MKLKNLTIGVLVLIGLLVGSLSAGALPAGRPGHAAAAPSAQSTDACAQDDDGQETADTEDKDDVREDVECGTQDESEVDEANEANEVDEADETAPAGLSLTADEAQAIVEAANPGATTLAVEYDRENGRDLFEVELDNGQDVQVDADTGEIVATEARD